jgi:hypothetical protein
VFLLLLVVPLHHETGKPMKKKKNVLQIFLQNQDKKEKKYFEYKI